MSNISGTPGAPGWQYPPVAPSQETYAQPIPTQPQQLVGVSGATRFGAYLLELVLIMITLGIGWLIWASTMGDTGQTPAKKLLGLRVLDLETMRAATLGKMFWSRGVLGGLVASIAFPVTLYILCFMPFWDDRNQNLYDKVSNTLVMRDGN